MRQGEKQGRIWRIVPKGAKTLAAKVPAATTPSPRRLGQIKPGRARRARTFLQVRPSPTAKELAAMLTEHADDPWMARMVASASSGQMGRVLSLAGDAFSAPTQ
jgi:hypothetical protein